MDLWTWAVVVGLSTLLLVRRTWDRQPRRSAMVGRLAAGGSLWREER